MDNATIRSYAMTAGFVLLMVVLLILNLRRRVARLMELERFMVGGGGSGEESPEVDGTSAMFESTSLPSRMLF